MKPYKLLKAKQSVVPLQVLSPVCTNGFHTPLPSLRVLAAPRPCIQRSSRLSSGSREVWAGWKSKAFYSPLLPNVHVVVTQFLKQWRTILYAERCLQSWEGVCCQGKCLAGYSAWKFSSFILEAFLVHQKEFCSRTWKHKWLNHTKALLWHFSA